MSREEGEVLVQLLTISEVAASLRYSQRTIRRLIKAGKLVAVKSGRCYRFRPQDIEKFVHGSLVDSTTQT